MWFIFAFTFALVSSVGSIVAKRVMRESDEYLYIWLSLIFTAPLLFLIIILFFQIPHFDKVFILVTTTSVLLDTLAAVLAYRAIRISEISLVAPLAAFNPVFTALISFIILGEMITLKGSIGILLVCVGAYTLQLSNTKQGWFTPVRTLFSNKGVRFSLVAYFLWALTPSLQKTAIFHTSPQVPPFAALTGIIGQIIVFTILVGKFSQKRILIIKKYFPIFIIVGLLGVIANISAFTAFSLTKLGFVTAVFKLSITFTVILGVLFFKEKNIKDKLLGSLIMLGGVLLLAV